MARVGLEYWTGHFSSFTGWRPYSRGRYGFNTMLVNELTSEQHKSLALVERKFSEAIAAHGAGQFEEARLHYEAVLDVLPRHCDTLYLYGTLLQQLGDHRGAILILWRAVRERPEDASYRNRLGAGLKALGQLEEARFQIAEALRLDPRSFEAYLHLADVRKFEGDQSGRYNMARRGLLLSPASFEIYTHLATGAPGTLDAEQALLWAYRITRIAPVQAKLWSNLAALYYAENMFDLAVRAAKCSLVLHPQDKAGCNNLATALFHSSNYHAARSATQYGLTIFPGWPELEFVLSECAFCLDDPETGWQNWPARLRMDEAPERLGLPNGEWRRGEALEGALLVCAEQGVGDEILFLSCLPDLVAEVREVIVECDCRLRAIIERSIPGIRTIERRIRRDTFSKIVFDYTSIYDAYGIAAHVYCGTLPEYYRRDVSRDPLPGGYLKPDPEAVRFWNHRLNALGPSPRLGLSWRSGLFLTSRRQHYFPDPTELVAALPRDAFTFINLQYGDCESEIQAIHEKTGLVINDFEGLDQVHELDRVAALISCLDLVIAPSTTVCHLASAMGVPTVSMDVATFRCADGRDPMFSTVHPVMQRKERFDAATAIIRTAEAATHFLSEGILPRVPLGNS